jgi:hypothetical protein
MSFSSPISQSWRSPTRPHMWAKGLMQCWSGVLGLAQPSGPAHDWSFILWLIIADPMQQWHGESHKTQPNRQLWPVFAYSMSPKAQQHVRRCSGMRDCSLLQMTIQSCPKGGKVDRSFYLHVNQQGGGAVLKEAAPFQWGTLLRAGLWLGHRQSTIPTNKGVWLLVL